MATDSNTATVGVNVSGAEYSWMPFVSASDLDYLASEGVTLIRLPISWERMQPTLNGPLDPTYLAGLENVLSEAAARGIQVVVDLHNYGSYNLNYAADAAANYGIVAPGAADASVIGSAAVPVSAFANFWSALAGQLSGHAGLAGYDIMNEPHDMGSTTIWPQAAQAAVNAIRTVDMNTPIYVEGYQYATAANWLINNANLHITDPANKIIYEAHQYFDNGSGQYAETYAQQGANPNTGVQELQPFLSWLKANSYQGFVGELGVPANDPNWNTVLNNTLNALQAAGVSSTVWNYVYSDPSGNNNSWWPVADSMSIDPSKGWGASTMESIFAHTSPTVTGFSPDTNVVGDGVTNATQLILTGTGAVGSTVQVYDGVTLLGTTIASGSGSWSFTTGQLTNATHSFTATDKDAAGTISLSSAALAVTVSVAPVAPTVTSFSPDSNVVGDSITNVNHLTLTGTAVAGSTVEVFDGATEIGTATANGSGAWSFVTGTLADGAHAFTAKDVDVAGNVSAASAALNVTIDTAAPNAPTVVSFSPDSNVVGDGITNVNHLTLTGTAVAGSTVEVFDGATEIGTATANGSGAWSFVTGTLADGAHAFTAKDVDVAGNVSAASAALNVTIDTVAPAAPTVASFSPDSDVVGDSITNVNHLTLTGTAVAGSTVEVFDGATEIGTATANGSGAWTFATGTLADGAHAFTAKDVDVAGNVSAASTALNITIDTAAPNAPTVVSFSPDSNVVGDSITNVNHLTLTGTAVAGSTVEVFDGATEIGTATANGSGAWTFATGTLADGAHALTAKDVDVAGNVSAASAALNVTIDTIAPKAPDLISDTPMSATAVLVTGTAEAGSTVKLYEGTTVLGTVQASASGTWSIATGSLTQGSHDFSATATDAAGNVSAMSAILDPVIGPTVSKVGNHFFLSANGTGPELKYHGVAVTVGQFGAWTPISVEQTASGYDVIFKTGNQYTEWSTDSNGNFIANITGALSGNSSTLEALETTFHEDLNGDGTIGIVATVIETSGSTGLSKVGNNFFFSANGTGAELKYHGVAVTVGQFGAWTPISVEQTASGYDVIFKTGNQYTEWSTDSNGNFTANITGALSGSSSTLKALETTFHQDLNGDGTINTPFTVIEATGSIQVALSHMTQAATIDAGATLELTGADSGSVTFVGTTGTLVLEHSSLFTGKLIGLTGDGNLSSSDQIDLKDVAFGSGTTESYVGNSSGGILTIKDAQDHTANLSLQGNYTNSTFTLSSDGHGGTIAIDPPKENFNFASTPAAANSPAARAVTVGGVGKDGFVFHQSTSGSFGNPDSLAHDGFAWADESHLLALSNDTQSDHHLMDTGHDSGFSHLDSVNHVNTHFGAPHGDFLIQ
jgi:hypothetical protein